MRFLTGTCSLAFAFVVAWSPVLAQTTAENIQQRVKDGQKVSISDDDGRELTGRIRTFPDALRIVANDKSIDVPYDRIVRIDRPPDTLANGALIGFGVGGVLGLALIAAEDNRDCEPFDFFCSDPTAGNYAAVTLLGAGLGTAVGVGIDALIRRDRVIYRRGGGAQATIAPVISARARAAVVSVSW